MCFSHGALSNSFLPKQSNKAIISDIHTTSFSLFSSDSDATVTSSGSMGSMRVILSGMPQPSVGYLLGLLPFFRSLILNCILLFKLGISGLKRRISYLIIIDICPLR